MPSAPLFLSTPIAFGADENAPTRFSGIAYSGGLIPDRGMVIDLASTRVEASMNVFAEHAHECPIGLIDRAVNESGRLTVEGELLSDIEPRAAEIVKRSKRGLRYQMSVGLFGASADFIAAGTSVQVNGADFAGPIQVLRNGHVREVSIVTLGADPNTHASFYRSGDGSSHEDHTMTLEEAQAKIAELEASVGTLKQRAETAEAEVTRVAREARLTSIRDLFAETGREFSEASAAPYVELPDTAFTAVAGDMRAIARSLPAHLFRELATGTPNGRGGNESPLLADAKARGWTQ